jgi:hypothetical protein
MNLIIIHWWPLLSPPAQDMKRYLLAQRAGGYALRKQLENSVIREAGDFIYIKADVPHQPINLSVHRTPRWLWPHAMMPTSKTMWLLTGERRSPHLMPRSVVVKRTKTVWVHEQQRERVAH